MSRPTSRAEFVAALIARSAAQDAQEAAQDANSGPMDQDTGASAKGAQIAGNDIDVVREDM